MAIHKGNRVDVILDCVTETRDGREVAKVFVRLVSEANDDEIVEPFPGAVRNVYQGWLGIPNDQQIVAVFAIDLGEARDGADLES